jgi:hypothetical protein
LNDRDVLTEKQVALCENAPADYSDLRAFFINVRNLISSIADLPRPIAITPSYAGSARVERAAS